MVERTWRLLITPPLDGPMNMAIDQAIMEAVAAGHVPPTLRFFAWVPPCLSLGHMQSLQDVDHARLAERGWDLVRRMTGGRAILHADELTYSVAVSASDSIVAGGIVESYRRLSSALVEGLRRMGIDLEADKRAKNRARTNKAVCFEVPSHYEITVNGKKLIGSAQVRKFGAVLQHGTLPLSGDITRICDVLKFENESQRETVRKRVTRRAITLEHVLGRIVTWEQAAEMMVESFGRVFALSFERSAELTTEEQARAEQLCVEQYASNTWNARF